MPHPYHGCGTLVSFASGCLYIRKDDVEGPGSVARRTLIKTECTKSIGLRICSYDVRFISFYFVHFLHDFVRCQSRKLPSVNILPTMWHNSCVDILTLQVSIVLCIDPILAVCLVLLPFSFFALLTCLNDINQRSARHEPQWDSGI